MSDAAGHRAIVLLNAAAGRVTEALASDVRARFASQGWSVDLAMDDTGAGLAVRATDAVDAGYTLVVAGGGDGSLNTIAGRLVGTEVAMGVLPVGTRNHFAKALGLPLGWPEAVDLIVRARPRGVDVGEVNGRLFLNNASVGLYPRFVHERGDCPHGGVRGLWLRTAAMMRAIAAQPVLDARLSLEGEAVTLRTRAVVVSNAPYALGGWKLAHRAGLEAGVLAFYAVPGEGRIALGRALWAARRGEAAPAIWVRQAPAGTLEVPGLTTLALDGECLPMSGPLAFRCRPGALRVLLSEGAAGVV